jgi:hypothetical protein
LEYPVFGGLLKRREGNILEIWASRVAPKGHGAAKDTAIAAVEAVGGSGESSSKAANQRPEVRENRGDLLRVS